MSALLSHPANLLRFTLAILLLGLARNTSATEAPTGNGLQPAEPFGTARGAPSKLIAAPSQTVEWKTNYRQAGLPEALMIGTSLGVAATFEYLLASPTEPNWSGPILFDESVRHALVAQSPRGRLRAANWSDALLVGTVAYPLIIDGLLVPLAVHRDPDLAWRMSVINAEAYSLTLALTSVTKHLARRERPYAARCPDEEGQYSCDGSDRVHSFFSGHSSITATGAGLTCAHHAALGLYGSPLLDGLACAFVASAAAATGTLRIMSDYHWATDVAVGYLVGFSSGFLIPMLLHYRAWQSQPASSQPTAAAEGMPMAFGLPLWSPGVVGFGAVGAF